MQVNLKRRTEVIHFQSLKFCQIDALSFKFLQAYPEEKSSGKSLYFFKKTKQKNYAQSKKLLVKIKFQAKFWQSLAPGLPKNARKVMRYCKNLKPYEIHCSKFGSLGMSQKSHFLDIFQKESSFQWRFIFWRSRHRKKIIVNVCDAVNSNFRIFYWFLKIHLGISWSRPQFSVC